MGLILTMLLFAVEILWNLIKLLGCAVWYVSTFIFKYLFIILKPVYKFMIKALPITTICVSCGLIFMVFGFLWDDITDNFNNTQKKNEQTEIETSSNEDYGIIDCYIDKAISRGDRINNIFDSALDNSKYEYIGGPIGTLILVIIVIALIPVILCVFLIIVTVYSFYEIPILCMIIDTIRHISIYIKYRPNVKETFIEWIHYAMSDYINVENSEDLYPFEDN